MFVFVFKDSNNNKIEITAPSKTKARKMVKNMHVGDSVFRFDSCRNETEDEWMAREGRNRQREANAQHEQTIKPKILKRRKAFGRNDRCPCRSGKKVKYCQCTKG